MDLYAEQVNYWKTSQTSPDKWLNKTKKLILDIDGTILGEGFGSDPTRGYSAYMLQFEIDGERYKIVWPVLPSQTDDEIAAKRQATTFIYHDVKARVMSAKVLGSKAAFFSYWQLPDGRTASQASVVELTEGIPYLLQAKAISE